jgi:hypothetical protein
MSSWLCGEGQDATAKAYLRTALPGGVLPFGCAPRTGYYGGEDALLDCGKFVSTRVWRRARLEAEQARQGGLYQNILPDGVGLWEDDAACPPLESPLLKPRARRVSGSS